KPYDPSKIANDSPTMMATPQSQGGGCGGLGQVIVAIVAVVVTVLSYGTLSELGYGMVTAGAAAGAAGSIASQVVGNAIGVQDGFSWKGVALGAIGGVVSAGLGGANILPDTGSAFINGAMRGALGSAITQGVAVVTGLQDKFSWKSVAASAVSAGVSQGLNSAMQYDPKAQFDFGKSFVSGFGGALAGTVVRGGKISGAQIAADAFGNIIGDALAKANNVPGVVGAEEKARILGYFADGPGTGFNFADDMAMRRASINPMGLPTTSATGNADGLYARNGMDVMDDTTDASGRRVVTVGQDQGPLAAFRSAGMSSAEAQAMYGQALATGQIRRNAIGMPIVQPGQTLYVDLNDLSQAGYGGNAIGLESRNRAAIAEEQMRQAAQEATYRNENYSNEGRSRPTYVATTYDDTQRMLNRMWDTPSGQFAKAYYAAGAAAMAQPVDGGGFGDSTNRFSNAGANIPLTQAANLAVGAAELAIGGTYNQVVRIAGGLASIPYTLAGTDAAVGVQEGFAESWSYSPRSDGAQTIMRGLAPVAQRVSNGLQAARDFTAGYIGDGATTILFAGTQFALEAGATVTGLRTVSSMGETLLASRARGLSGSGRSAAVEFAGGTQVYVSDLSHVTGKAAASRNRAIDAIIKEDFPNTRLTYTPEYSPFIGHGVTQEGAGIQIGKNSFSSRASLRDTIIHEELHNRWWSRGIYDHHPLGSAKEARFYETIDRYNRMRGW
ncbi:hypothetical protein PMI12_02871, partial [Variovorax sp. CF313]|uniref:hypothetical protein n=1 Tax=Variovorax sp. CF313 TaxID=1144315 RepID=UPI000270F35D